MGRIKSQYRTALVTGASSGLGLAISTMLLSEGVLVWGSAPRGKAPAPYPQTGFTPVELDLDDRTAALEAVERAATEAGGCFDLVILNAGQGLFAPFVLGDWAGWERQLQSMVVTNSALAHRLAAPMLARGQGGLVFVTAPGGVFQTGMTIARAALSALATGLRSELQPYGVEVLELRCSWLRTDFLRNMPAARLTHPAGEDESRQAAAWSKLGWRIESARGPSFAAERLRRALERGLGNGVVRAGPARWRLIMAKLFVWLGAGSSVDESEDY